MRTAAAISPVAGAFAFLSLLPVVVADFSEGRQLYARRCVPCHVRKKIEFDPAAYGQRGLWSETARMAPLARLGYDEQLAIASYLEAVRTGRETLPPDDPLVLRRKAEAAAATNEFGLAQTLVQTRCASCHAHKQKPIAPEKLSAETLKQCIERMASAARLTPEQTRLVTRYLDAVRTKKAVLVQPSAK
ncbi:MAG: hypothetical protein N3B01_05595 [Verrucomicrobiae bacterium]|nr:hypothetical protein [Verrucomicrobiae bacterium]